MEQTQQANFSGWALVELMGHQTEIGYVTTEAYGQAVMFRIDTPALEDREWTLEKPEYIQSVDGYKERSIGTKVKRAGLPAKSRLVAPGALYAINPCTEEAAKRAIERQVNRPLILVDVPALALVASASANAHEVDDLDEEEEG